MKKELEVLELFSGIGATSQALKDLGIKFNATYVELNPKVVEVKNYIWDSNDVPIDILNFKPEINKDYDLVVGGFPCQPFSNAGNKLGFDDPRGKLYLEALRVIEEANPKYVILENVKTILSKQNKWIIDEIKSTLLSWGYYVNIQTISSNIFVPQNRERVFIIASKAAQPRSIIKDKNRYTLKPYLLPSEYLDKSLLLKKDESFKTIFKDGTIDIPKLLEFFPTVQNKVFIKNQAPKKWRLFGNREQSYHYMMSDGTSREIGFRDKEKNWLLPISRNYTTCILNDSLGNLSTLTASNNKMIVDTNQKTIRKLSPIEAMKLMGWGYQEEVMGSLLYQEILNEKFDKLINDSGFSHSQWIHVLGNSMVVPVMGAIITELIGDE